MIQRIQTVYLLLAASAIISCLFFPIISFNVNKALEGETNVIVESYEITALAKMEITDGQKKEVQKNFLEIIFVCAISLLAIVSIFIYKDREVQIQLTRLFLFLTTILIVIMVIKIYGEINIFGIENKKFHMGAYLPSIAIVFSFLASRAIQKDENLVNAAERLR